MLYNRYNGSCSSLFRCVMARVSLIGPGFLFTPQIGGRVEVNGPITSIKWEVGLCQLGGLPCKQACILWILNLLLHASKHMPLPGNRTNKYNTMQIIGFVFCQRLLWRDLLFCVLPFSDLVWLSQGNHRNLESGVSLILCLASKASCCGLWRVGN